MGQIHVLPSALASQIAAGEVVDRPASAAKELVENALDAGATRCDVACEGGGVVLLSVTDDGVGMTEPDARLALERHATSKLSSLADLEQMRTYGFRGEALPSIASVSRLRLSTRERGSEFGVTLEVVGGGLVEARTAGLATGTKIEVRDLFFNVPARRKFLRSTGTESAHITSVVESAALCRPDVTFTLTREGRLNRELLRVSSRRERLLQLLPDEKLSEIRGERGPLVVEAHLAAPNRARPGTLGLWLVVNGRIVRDRMLAATVAQAYAGSLASGQYPRGAVFVELPLEHVDVNVHPQKTEVRFVEPRAVSDAVYQIVSDGLARAFGLTPSARSNRDATSPPYRPFARPPESLPAPVAERHPARLTEPGDPWGFAQGTPVLREFGPVTDAPPAIPGASMLARPTLASAETAKGAGATLSQELGSLPSPKDSADHPQVRPLDGDGLPQGPVTGLRFLAQLRRAYLLCEGDEGLTVVDQRAASLLVHRAKLVRELLVGALESQALLFPAMLSISLPESQWLEQDSELLHQLGFDLRMRARDRASVHAIPKLLAGVDVPKAMHGVLTELAPRAKDTPEEKTERLVTLIAGHAALRHGDLVEAGSASALLSELEGLSDLKVATQDRAVIATLTYRELETKGGRR